MGKLNVDGTEIQVLQIEEDDYISLTDMVRKIDNGPALIEKWLRNKNTIYILSRDKNPDINAVLIEDGLSQKERLIKLNKIAIHQMSILEEQTTKVLK